MLTVDEAFRKFKSRLELNDREQKNASARHTEVREFVRTKFAIDRDFLTGSYARYTKTKPLKDIDIFFVMKQAERHYRDEAAGVVLDKYKEVLVEKYGEKAVRRQSRSINIDFGVDVNFNKVARPAEHGKSGLLTMKGFLSNKPGLPHYNYSARVFTDFMGSIFEVPPEVFDQRGTATAASTVDPKSICFSCHQNLTPLAHQRLRWDDDGNYRVNDPVTGAPIDDSDRGLVPSYAYKGQGLAAFAQSAVKKEAFIRRTLNAQYRLLLGRDMRSSEDERDVYKQLWDITASSGGNLKSVLKTIATSRRYQRLP